MSSLKRELGLGYATLFGVGLILGAGIYVLVGRSAAFAGDAVWASVAFAALIAISTGLSYAELASMYPTAASTYTYVEEAFPAQKQLAFIAAWLIFFGGVAGAGTAALGFARYFYALTGFEAEVAVTIALLALLSLLNWWGVKESALMSAVFTIIEAGGLLLVAFLGLLLPQRSPNYLAVNPNLSPVTAIVAGAAVFYFAYTGFEYQPTLSEETKNSERVMPKAIVLALLATTAVYLLTAVGVVRLMSWDALGRSKAPLAEAASKAWPPAYALLMGIALFATTNTVLGFLVSSSRLLYGLGEEKVIWTVFKRIDARRKTPAVSVFFTGFLAVFLVLVTDFLPKVTGWKLHLGGYEYELIDLVGKTASLAVLLAFMLVNASVVVLRLKKPDADRHFKVPISVGRVPLLPLFANALIFFFLTLSFTDWIVWVSTALVTGVGFLARKTVRLS